MLTKEELKDVNEKIDDLKAYLNKEYEDTEKIAE